MFRKFQYENFDDGDGDPDDGDAYSVDDVEDWDGQWGPKSVNVMDDDDQSDYQDLPDFR